MSRLILFGASRHGLHALYMLKEKGAEVDFFCDSDSKKWGTKINGVEVIPPDRLKNYPDHLLIISSTYAGEISKTLREMGINDFMEFPLPSEQKFSVKSSKYNFKTIDLPSFLLNSGVDLTAQLSLTIAGTLLDYMFLKTLAAKFNLKTYLEIGTFMGESIAVVYDYVDKCYSVSLPDDMLEERFTHCGMDNFSRYFSRGKENVVHYEGDSALFDYKQIQEKIDLVFIDGDHSYTGVYIDTKKIFGELIDRDNTIVVWHDAERKTVGHAIIDALSDEDAERVYKVFGNLCAVYIPDKYMSAFKTERAPGEIYSYNISINKDKTVKHTI